MPTICILYGTTTGNTEEVSRTLADLLQIEGFTVTLHNVHERHLDVAEHYDHLILAGSTWNEGELQDDWADVLDEFTALKLKDKKVAILGLGDQAGYPEYFVDGMADLAAAAGKAGAKIVGHWPRDGYEFTHSRALDGGLFLGLVIDQDNQEDQTVDRLRKWVSQLVKEFSA